MNIAFGTWRIKDEQIDRAINGALEAGFRHFDTAEAYGNDMKVGEVLCHSTISRQELWISNKLWNEWRGYESALEAFSRTIKRMKVDYLDSYLIHWPAVEAVDSYWEHTNAETWRAFEKLYNDGYVKKIGVSNFKPHHLKSLEKSANIKPMINQIEFHPGFTQKETVDYCKKTGIELEAWGPLGKGKLLKKKIIMEMAERYEKTPAQLLIRFCIQNNICPIVRSSEPTRIHDNVQIEDFELSNEDMKILNEAPYMGGSGLDPDRPILFG